MAKGNDKCRDLFSVKPKVDSNKNVKKRKKQKDKNEGDGDKKRQKVDKQVSDIDMQPLTYEALTNGQVILGCVQEVRNYELLVSLPHKLVGTVTLARISKAYTALLTKIKEVENEAEEEEIHTLQELYSPGQYIVTQVVSVEDINGKFKVNLTIEPREVNFGISASHLQIGLVLPCAVTSVEDNGFIMDTGISNIRGAFLKNTDIDDSGIVGVGNVVRCMITKIMWSDDGHSLRLSLSADAKTVKEATVDVADTTNLALLLPGTAVNTSVSKVQKEGLNLILAEFDGVVSRLHLKKPLDQLNQYKMAQRVQARVLYIMPLTKVVHFTLQKNVCNESDHLHGMKVGDRIENAEIYESKFSGVYLKLRDNCRAFCSGNRLTDKIKTPKHFKRDFPVGSKHMCRIIKYDYMDQLFIVSIQKSVLEQQLVGYSEVKPGEILQATLKGYNAHGAQVAISKFVDGHIPFLHLTNTNMKHPERKYNVGDVIKTRVLKVNPERKHILLTCKEHLVESKEPIVTEYTKEVENTITEGCIVKVASSGLLVAMYNDVKGFVPKMKVSTEPVDNLQTLFTEGQVLKCKILQVIPENKKIILSLIIDGNSPLKKMKGKQIKQVNKVQMREKVNCVVQEVREDNIMVIIKPQDIKAEIPVHHLSDNFNKISLIKELVKTGDEIHNAVVFRKDTTTVTLTLKSSVYHWVDSASEEAQSSNELLEHESYPAAVIEVRTYGLLVLIPVGVNGCKQLVHVKNFTDSGIWLDCTDLGIPVGQSISVVFKGKDKQNRPILSSALKDNLKNVTQSSIQLLHNHFKNEDMIRKQWLKYGTCNAKGQLAKFEVGTKLKAKVTVVTPPGIFVTIDNSKVTGILSQDHLDVHTKIEVGQDITVKVLHVNQEEECLELTARKDHLMSLHTQSNSKVKVGKQIKCEVLLARKNFIMVALKTCCVGRIAYIPSQRHMNDFKGRQSLYTVGHEYCMVIKYIKETLVLGILKQHDKKEDVNIFDDQPSIQFKSSVGVPVREEEDIEAEAYNVEEIALRKLLRVRTDSQCSLGSLGDITEANIKDKGDKIDKEKFKKLVADSTPQVDEEALQAEIAKKKLEKKQIRLLKRKKELSDASEQLEESMEMDETKDHDAVEAMDENLCESVSQEQPKACKKKNPEVEVDDSGVDETMDPEDKEPEVPSRKKPYLKLSSGFVWEIPDVADDVGKNSSESEEEEEQEAKKKKAKKLSKSEREIMAKEEEKRLQEMELARLEKDRSPQSALDYEELLQHSPNSSALWIQFISFHLESAEVDKAKAVTRRALQVIDIREEEERLNVWTVLLRLEVFYGTPESVVEAYREAQITNDQLKMQMAMAMVYAENNKLKEAEKVYFAMTKKFGKIKDVWLKAAIFFFSHNMANEARRYMDRALLSLEKTEHVDLINRFGQLEFRFGEAERGRTIFESLLSNYPKRIDIWSVYVDILRKNGDIEGARHVLERMTGLKLRLQKMRFVFKKFLEFEKDHGSPQSVEAVRTRVEEFVASTLH
ncbi:RRP5-like [Homarus americanus]|uniref:RRP5-like n=1 Tax=Homarus americanus TaxID=6706 RepID=A0A8J5MZE4_HOMAM|nr:RRP5-like [Homarus americanus]